MKRFIVIAITLLTVFSSCKTSKNTNCDAYGQNVGKDTTVTYS